MLTHTTYIMDDLDEFVIQKASFRLVLRDIMSDHKRIISNAFEIVHMACEAHLTELFWLAKCISDICGSTALQNSAFQLVVRIETMIWSPGAVRQSIHEMLASYVFKHHTDQTKTLDKCSEEIPVKLVDVFLYRIGSYRFTRSVDTDAQIVAEYMGDSVPFIDCYQFALAGSASQALEVCEARKIGNTPYDPMYKRHKSLNAEQSFYSCHPGSPGRLGPSSTSYWNVPSRARSLERSKAGACSSPSSGDGSGMMATGNDRPIALPAIATANECRKPSNRLSMTSSLRPGTRPARTADAGRRDQYRARCFV